MTIQLVKKRSCKLALVGASSLCNHLTKRCKQYTIELVFCQYTLGILLVHYDDIIAKCPFSHKCERLIKYWPSQIRPGIIEAKGGMTVPEATKADIERLEDKIDQQWQSSGEDFYAQNLVIEKQGRDITHIKQNMATKADLVELADKMATKEDLAKLGAQLEAKMATKADIQSLAQQINAH